MGVVGGNGDAVEDDFDEARGDVGGYVKGCVVD